MRVYRNIIATFDHLDTRVTRYQFDIDRDIDWTLPLTKGLFVPHEFLSGIGLRTDELSLNETAMEEFQWIYAASICSNFVGFERHVLNFIKKESDHLGATNSIALMRDEEAKHVDLFQGCLERIFDQMPSHLRDIGRPIIASCVGEFVKTIEAASAVYLDRPSYHYAFWANTLFLEEFTIYFYHSLRKSQGAINGLWRIVHELHCREEVQHLVTDAGYLSTLDISENRRYEISCAIGVNLLRRLGDYLCYTPAKKFAELYHPRWTRWTLPTPLTHTRFFEDVFTAPEFRRSRAFLPALSAMRA